MGICIGYGYDSVMQGVSYYIAERGHKVMVADDFHGEVNILSEPACPLVFVIEVEAVGPAEIIHEFFWCISLYCLVGVGRHK